MRVAGSVRAPALFLKPTKKTNNSKKTSTIHVFEQFFLTLCVFDLMNSPIDSAYFDTEHTIHFKENETVTTIQIPLKSSKKPVDKFRLLLKSIDKNAKPSESAGYCDIQVVNELPSGVFAFENTNPVHVYQSDGYAEFLVNRYPPKYGAVSLKYGAEKASLDFYEKPSELVCEFCDTDSESVIRVELCQDYREEDQDEFTLVLGEVSNVNGVVDLSRRELKVIVENDVGKLVNNSFEKVSRVLIFMKKYKSRYDNPFICRHQR